MININDNDVYRILVITHTYISDMVGGSCDPGHHLTHLPDTGTQLRVRGQQMMPTKGTIIIRIIIIIEQYT